MIVSKLRTKKGLISCADAQAGLRLCCSQTPEDKFSRVEARIVDDCLIYYMYYLYVLLVFVTLKIYRKACLKRPLKNRQTEVIKTNGRIMNVESIAGILQYVRPALSHNRP